MKLDYIDLSSKFYGIRRGQTYERKVALRVIEFPHPLPHLIPQPPRFVTLRSEMDTTS